MKNIFLILISLLVLQSCNRKINDYVSISGHFEGLTKNDTLMKISSRKYNKNVLIDADGNFNDTLHIKEPDYFTMLLSKRTRIAPYFNIGDDLTIKGDITDLNNTLVFKGRGAVTNNYLIKRIKEVTLFNERINSLYASDSVEFVGKLDAFKDKMTALLDDDEIDTAVVNRELRGMNNYMEGAKVRYKRQHDLQAAYAKGQPSPKFTDLENVNGETTSLDDFKGKYVYIDIWATWCRPCLAQIPALKALEKEYHDKNIEFVSISTDAPDKHNTWINMIKEKGMTGTQLYAGENVSFMQGYKISTIPRFIFIDPNGNIIDANAPRPSSTEDIKKMFDEVGL